ncbi:MAG: metal-dependent transcriptional regulator [Candidatus Marinimicrobia bacterium]|nr:metal-dependent transcriptional regulator [Candidatus Neomarinimicrobiota bacterium]MCF7828637.1 metal-dependent transcriptional regulator [Candidatus Neomarinimicrobiota bacterium]MCF7880378.1 metal-dependent transcriptional regulator [Candidatus Neomarinimicrobiota bacterium]
MSKQNSLIEEALEYLWITRERGTDSLEDFRELMAEDNQPVIDTETLDTMESEGLITRANGNFQFTPEGDTTAAKIIRRHRLAERLFKDVLNVDMRETETIACELEHILSAEVTESVCTFLGHPPQCPHGRPIPQGKCCKRYRSEVKPILSSVRQLELRAPARIAFITPEFHKRYQRLTSLGVTPGTELVLTQRHPSFVIKVGETEIAIDGEIADEIYVKRIGNRD